MRAPPETTLAALRAELDAIDDQLHDLLMRRAEVVERVARDGGKTGTKIRPGREAAMLRRRLARHRGSLPPQTIIRFWREMFAGALMIEGGQVIAVADDGDGERLALAREHFGPLTPTRRCASIGTALDDVRDGRAQVAVLPPLKTEWWATLATELRIIGKLPFWAAKPPGTAAGEAWMVARMNPDDSGADVGLLTLPASAEVPEALAQAGLTLRALHPPCDGLVLAEVEALVAEDDARLETLHGARVLGGYAIPIAAA